MVFLMGVSVYPRLGGAGVCSAGLDLEEALDESDGRWGYSGDAAGLAEGEGADAV